MWELNWKQLRAAAVSNPSFFGQPEGGEESNEILNVWDMWMNHLYMYDAWLLSLEKYRKEYPGWLKCGYFQFYFRNMSVDCGAGGGVI